MPRLSLLVASLAALAAAAAPPGDTLPEPLRTRLDTIVVEDVVRHATFLTSDECAGRDTPQGGLNKARDYLVEQHKAFGLESGVADGSFLYPFDVSSITWSDDDGLQVVQGNEIATFEPGVDFVPVRGSGSGGADAEVVFCGYGIFDATEKYDDFKGVDVKDKVVAVLTHEPRETKKGRAFKGEEWTSHGAITSKARTAAERGAKAVIVFTDPLNHQDLSVLKGEHPRYGKLGEPGRPAQGSIPVVHASGAVADRLFGAGKLLAWQKTLDQKLSGSAKVVPQTRVRLKVELRNVELPVHNVVAAKRGVDPERRDEWIILGAHYDHIGIDEYGRIFYGADDNASGTACLLEIGEALASPDVALRRSVLLIHFAGEEKGLLGAAAFCKKPPFPASSMFAMLNMDMVGRGRPHEIDAVGLATSKDFAALVRKATSLSRARLKVGEDGMAFFQRSDQYEFWKLGVPVLFFMEPKEHEDYHRVTDTMEKLVLPKIAETGKLLTGLLWLLAEADKRPEQAGIGDGGR